MNLWAILGPIILALVQKFLARQSGQQKLGVVADEGDKKWCNEQADKLEQAVNQHKAGAAAATDGGLITQVMQLIGLFRAGDLAGALRLAFEILIGSSVQPVTLPTAGNKTGAAPTT
jgi:hypothetical protein